MIQLGITGGIGSGKSTVCSFLETLNFPVYYADQRAKYITENDNEVIFSIFEIFGEEAILNNKPNRNWIAKKSFQNPILLTKLNQVIHPKVAIDYQNWLENNKYKDFVFKEAALLIEAESYKNLDYLIVITAPLKTRIDRVLLRDPQRNESDVKKIIKNQVSEKVRLNKANFIIRNGDNDLIIPQVLKIIEEARL